MNVSYFKRYRMHFDLHRELPESRELPEGYRLCQWKPELLTMHAEAKYRSFRHELDANVFPCLGQKEGCISLMREISRRNGFVPEATWLVVLNKKPRNPIPCGTVQGINDQPSIGSIQNLGIVAEHRAMGLGRALLIRALQGFREVGLRTASLEVTAKNTDAIRLYERFGFKIVKTVYKSIELVAV